MKNNIILTISLRNLFRQKRRNILLGIGIAFGMMILVMANSFSAGVSDILINRILIYTAGHIQLSQIENGNRRMGRIRDKDRMVELITNNFPTVKEVRETVNTFIRAIGNGKSDNTVIIGVAPNREFYEGMNPIAGNVYDLTNESYPNPIYLYEDKAKDLNVTLYDTLSVRVNTVDGQVQTAKLTVVAILQSAGLFASMTTFIHIDNAKKLLGYQPHETGYLQLIMHEPKLSIMEADRLHQLLLPKIAMINGELQKGGLSQSTFAFGFSTNREDFDLFISNITIAEGDNTSLQTDKGIAISTVLAKRLGVKLGDTVQHTHRNRFTEALIKNDWRVIALFNPESTNEENLVFIPHTVFEKTYNQNLPHNNQTPESILTSDSKLAPILVKEWLLMKRSRTTEENQAKWREFNKTKRKGAVTDVSTMYENASQILQMEGVLNLITFIAVMVLFFIILIGVINTLRMTIRERTREIGTIRAIGMQKKDVRNSFILETLFLSFFASLAGIILALLLMGLLSLIKFDTNSPLSIFFVNQSLYFLPNIGSILGNLLTILQITLITAYFPARKAAKMSAADALRHYE